MGNSTERKKKERMIGGAEVGSAGSDVAACCWTRKLRKEQKLTCFSALSAALI